tara:strand:- start:97 stop:456 length:360 start_codon:yes stop_codon:yes gene_type:complete
VASFLFLNQYTQVAVADDETIAEMALIVMELKHYPSASAKASLVAIAEASENSVVEKQIATAIANIQHKVTSADSKRLTEIIGDDSSANGARVLATVVNGINHFPTKQDQEVLRTLAYR